ncbi:hypothetical protein BCV72DRAFT_3312 [Rhizopus microsporus var. microsporus]|uniref:Fork-head domain-containing protein n=2 Tax=Rhizopus microsporus TaxID=58291 RepID=A0A1X0RFM4_RHIZD|nr:hypothetical protein BCV72DRAFT_3312 [Rhizopus microsporus var. microsporus]
MNSRTSSTIAIRSRNAKKRGPCSIEQAKVDTSSQNYYPLGPIHIVPSWNPINKKEKPPYSYATIIGHAILSSKERKLTLNEIYQWIIEHYPYYTNSNLGWQNSVRHNLSLHKAFVKIQRETSDPGQSRKGCYWTIQPGKEQAFIDNLEAPTTKRSGRRRSSQLSAGTPYPETTSDTAQCTSSNSSVYTTTSSSSSSLYDYEYYYSSYYYTHSHHQSQQYQPQQYQPQQYQSQQYIQQPSLHEIYKPNYPLLFTGSTAATQYPMFYGSTLMFN